MIICNTLWTNKSSLLENNFGWLTPQHHLMGWALSVLRLSRYYKTIHLHTDKSGKEMLVDYLGLPYAMVFEDYNNLDCEPYLWALPKLLTYAKQCRPFLHVDGDVMVWQEFKNDFLSSDLIAQNLEKGTTFYWNFFAPLLNELKYLPKSLKQNLTLPNMRAFNAGIIGGHDLQFFKSLITEATQIVEKNKDCKLDGSLNMIVEQLLFYSLAKKEKKKITCLMKEPFSDGGYDQNVFADFPNVDKLKYLHLIGPHKRNREVCDMLARYLRQENEHVFLRIVSLFKRQHFFYGKKFNNIKGDLSETNHNQKLKFKYTKSLQWIKSVEPNLNFVSNTQLEKYVKRSVNFFLKELFSYEKKLRYFFSKFKKIDFLHFKQIENDSMSSLRFLSFKREERITTFLYRNPYIEIVRSAFDWTTMQMSQTGDIKVRCSERKNIVIGVVPELYFSGYREIVLDETCINILVLTESKISCKLLLEKINAMFLPPDNEDEYIAACELVFLKIDFLIKNKVLFISDEKSSAKCLCKRTVILK